MEQARGRGGGLPLLRRPVSRVAMVTVQEDGRGPPFRRGGGRAGAEAASPSPARVPPLCGGSRWFCRAAAKDGAPEEGDARAGRLLRRPLRPGWGRSSSASMGSLAAGTAEVAPGLAEKGEDGLERPGVVPSCPSLDSEGGSGSSA